MCLRFASKVMSDTVPFQRQLVSKFEDIAHQSGSGEKENAFVVMKKIEYS